MSKCHELKTINPYFDMVWHGLKTFEVRLNDRNFKEGDKLWLKEFSKDDCCKGRSILVEVTFILFGGDYGIDPKYCVMAFRVIEKIEPAAPNMSDARKFWEDRTGMGTRG